MESRTMISKMERWYWCGTMPTIRTCEHQDNGLIYAEAKNHLIVSLHDYRVFHQLKDMGLG